MKIVAVVLLSVLSGCAHLVQYTGAVPDPAADEAFARELFERLDAEVRSCYGKVIITDPVPLEIAVDDAGSPIAVRSAGPLFGSTLGGCLEAVAFRAQLGAGNGPRLGRAVASLKVAGPPALIPVPKI